MEPYLGEIRMFAGNVAPSGWNLCDGTLLEISDYDVLFSLIGTTYGGDGVTNFALPDLRGRLPVGQGSGQPPAPVAKTGGAEQVTLTDQQAALHAHTMSVTSVAATTPTLGSGLAFAEAASSDQLYAVPTGVDQPVVPLNPATVSQAGGGLPHDNVMPSLVVNFIIALYGVYPSSTQASSADAQPDAAPSPGDPDAFIGEIRIMGFNFAPLDWLVCDGASLPVYRNRALYAVIGNLYGGDTQNFNLPDLRGQVPMSQGQGPGLTNRTMGQKVGSEGLLLATNQVAKHTHNVMVNGGLPPAVTLSNAPTQGKSYLSAPTGPGRYVRTPISAFSAAKQPNTTLAPQTLGPFTVQQQPHDNMQPYLALNFCICTSGVSPQ